MFKILIVIKVTRRLDALYARVRKNFRTVSAFVLFTILIVTGFRDILNQRMLAYSDMSPFPANVSEALEAVYSSWQPPIGAFWYSSLDLVLILKSIFIFVTCGNAVLAQRLFIILPYLLSFFGFHLILQKYLRSEIARFFGAFIYSINPMTIIIFQGGAMGWMYVHGLLPFLFLLMLSITENESFVRKLRNTCLFGIVFAIAISQGVQILLFVMPFLFFVIYTSLSRQNARSFLGNFAFLLVALLIGVGLSIPVFLPMKQELWGYISPGSVSTVAVEMNYKYENSIDPILSILGLQPTGLSIFGWDSDPLMVIISLTIPFLAFSSLLVRREWPDFIVFNSILAVGAMSFIYLGYLQITLPLFQYFRLLEAIPVSNVTSLLLVFAYASLVGYALDELHTHTSKRANPKPGLVLSNVLSTPSRRLTFYVFFLLVLLVMNWPLLTGNMGLFMVRSEDSTVIPSEFYKICQWLEEKRKEDPFARSLWLPYSYKEVEIKIKFLDRQSVTVSRALIRYLTTNFTELQNEALQRIFIDKKSDLLGTLLAPLSVKYIILNLESDYTGIPRFEYERGGVIGFVGSPSEFREVLRQQQDLTLATSSEKFEIYENTQCISHLSVLKSGLNVIGPSGRDVENILEVLSVMGGLASNVKTDLGLLTTDVSSQNTFFSSILLIENETFGVDQNGEYIIVTTSEKPLLIHIDGELTNSTNYGEGFAARVTLAEGLHNLTIMEEPRDMPEPVLWWRFDEGSGDVIKDHSSYYHDGKATGEFAWILAQGRMALNLEGKGGVVLGDEGAIMRGNFTVVVLVDFDNVGDEPILRATAADASEYVGLIAFGGHALGLASNGMHELKLRSDMELETHSLYQFALGRELGKSFFLTINGRIVKSLRDTLTDTSYESILIGQGIHGRIYDFRIYNETLSEDDIQYLMRGAEELKLKPKALALKLQETQADSWLLPRYQGYLESKVLSTCLYRHELTLNPNGTAVIYLSEPFDSRWSARYKNGTELEHFVAFGATNSFILESSHEEKIVVFFEEQTHRNNLLNIWIISWISVFSVMVLMTDRVSKFFRRRAGDH